MSGLKFQGLLLLLFECNYNWTILRELLDLLVCPEEGHKDAQRLDIAPMDTG